MNNAPIGIFDSGLGGLTVARAVIDKLPDEEIIYLGDTEHTPYGPRAIAQVRSLTLSALDELASRGVKALVIACNTASSHALKTLAEENDIPVIGVIYAGALSAVRATENGRIGVIGTRGTVSSEIYPKVIENLAPGLRVFQKACPMFVPLVEEGLLHDSVTDEMAARYLQELKEKYVDTLVLGCTHYPLLRGTIGRIMGDQVKLVNPAYETALELKDILAREKLLNPGDGNTEGKYRFYVSDLAENFRDFANSILPTEQLEAKKIEIEEY